MVAETVVEHSMTDLHWLTSYFTYPKLTLSNLRACFLKVSDKEKGTGEANK